MPQLRIWVDFWTLLGAAPTPLPYSEQYSALSTGIIDAIDSDVFSVVGFKFFEQAKNLTLTGHWFLPKAVRVNAAWLDKLPEDMRALVRSTAKEAFSEQRRVNRAKADETLAQLKGLGGSGDQARRRRTRQDGTADLVALCRIRQKEPGNGEDDRRHPCPRLSPSG